MRDHRKLRAFGLADELAVTTYKTTAAFPRAEQFGLTSQMRRAAVSAVSNIVEGCARATQTEYLRFLDIAFGSVREVEYRASLACRLGYLSDSDFQSLNNLCNETLKVLGSLIRSLRCAPFSPRP